MLIYRFIPQKMYYGFIFQHNKYVFRAQNRTRVRPGFFPEPGSGSGLFGGPVVSKTPGSRSDPGVSPKSTFPKNPSSKYLVEKRKIFFVKRKVGFWRDAECGWMAKWIIASVRIEGRVQFCRAMKINYNPFLVNSYMDLWQNVHVPFILFWARQKKIFFSIHKIFIGEIFEPRTRILLFIMKYHTYK